MTRRFPTNACVDFILKDETLVSPARHLPADKPGVITGGYGETDPRRVHEGMIVSPELAHSWFLADASAISYSIEHMCAPVILTDGQFDGLFSFVYNEGAGTLHKSSILANILTGHLRAAADRFLVYDMANGRHLSHLLERRKVERSWFLSGLVDLPSTTIQ
jgi:GH24 family phage-related lysozyme (muramidase)